jgi:Fe-S cluster assembly protein SufD
MTTELAQQENKYAAAFDRVLVAQTGEPAWLRSARESAFAEFSASGFPTVDLEEWKYTNVAAIAKTSFEPVLSANGTSLGKQNALAPYSYPETSHSRLVFVNGIFRQDLSDTSGLSAGIVAVDLNQAASDKQYEAVLRRAVEREAQTNGFVSLNTALFSGGLFLQITRGHVGAAPIHLLFVAEAQNGTAPAALPRVVIHAEANSQATVIESYAGSGSGAYLTNAVIDFELADSARISHYRLQREGAKGFHVSTTRAELGAKASYETTSINFGAAISRHNVEVRMDHEGAECAVDGLYMVDESQHTDTHSVIDHRQPHCNSRQLYKGILDGKSRAVFNGKVFVRHGAQQTDAQQTNKNLLLSKEAQVDTKPQLEIYADDVKCTHGAAVGQLEEDELFYLESRGINPTLAKNMLTYGFAGEVIEKIKIESIRRELDEVVLNRLHSEFQLES